MNGTHVKVLRARYYYSSSLINTGTTHSLHQDIRYTTKIICGGDSSKEFRDSLACCALNRNQASYSQVLDSKCTHKLNKHKYLICFWSCWDLAHHNQEEGLKNDENILVNGVKIQNSTIRKTTQQMNVSNKIQEFLIVSQKSWVLFFVKGK